MIRSIQTARRLADMEIDLGQREFWAVGAVVGELAGADDLGDVGGVFEGMAIVEDEVGDFAGFDAAVAVFDLEDFGGVDGDAGQGAFESKSVNHGHGGFVADDAGFWNVTFESAGDGDFSLVSLLGTGYK